MGTYQAQASNLVLINETLSCQSDLSVKKSLELTGGDKITGFCLKIKRVWNCQQPSIVSTLQCQ